jgi:hypothetical protein
MRLIAEQFATSQEAQAFMHGIELANDSDLAAHEPVRQGTHWTVYVHDWNGSADDVCPLCGAGKDE